MYFMLRKTVFHGLFDGKKMFPERSLETAYPFGAENVGKGKYLKPCCQTLQYLSARLFENFFQNTTTDRN